MEARNLGAGALVRAPVVCRAGTLVRVTNASQDGRDVGEGEEDETLISSECGSR